jgi:hypothetical protein
VYTRESGKKIGNAVYTRVTDMQMALCMRGSGRPAGGLARESAKCVYNSGSVYEYEGHSGM